MALPSLCQPCDQPDGQQLVSWLLFDFLQVRKMKDKPAALPSRVRAPCLHPCSLSEGLPSPGLASPTGSPSSAGF